LLYFSGFLFYKPIRKCSKSKNSIAENELTARRCKISLIFLCFLASDFACFFSFLAAFRISRAICDLSSVGDGQYFRSMNFTRPGSLEFIDNSKSNKPGVAPIRRSTLGLSKAGLGPRGPTARLLNFLRLMLLSNGRSKEAVPSTPPRGMKLALSSILNGDSMYCVEVGELAEESFEN
jgi:hypothetical protein